MNVKWLHMVAFILVIVGALNWGLVGLLGYNLVDALLGAGSGLAKLVYALVGVSGVWLILNHGKECKVCK